MVVTYVLFEKVVAMAIREVYTYHFDSKILLIYFLGKCQSFRGSLLPFWRYLSKTTKEGDPRPYRVNRA